MIYLYKGTDTVKILGVPILGATLGFLYFGKLPYPAGLDSAAPRQGVLKGTTDTLRRKTLTGQGEDSSSP